MGAFVSVHSPAASADRWSRRSLNAARLTGVCGKSERANQEGLVESDLSEPRNRSWSDQRRSTLCAMPKTFTAFRVAPELLEAMRAGEVIPGWEIKAVDGVPMSVQIDFAIRA